MKVKYMREIDAKETSTQGKHSYLVALRTGGVMEDPVIDYCNFQVIWADTAEEAREKYNKINNCSYYYGQVMEQIS